MLACGGSIIKADINASKAQEISAGLCHGAIKSVSSKQLISKTQTTPSRRRTNDVEGQPERTVPRRCHDNGCVHCLFIKKCRESCLKYRFDKQESFSCWLLTFRRWFLTLIPNHRYHLSNWHGAALTPWYYTGQKFFSWYFVCLFLCFYFPCTCQHQSVEVMLCFETRRWVRSGIGSSTATVRLILATVHFFSNNGIFGAQSSCMTHVCFERH